MLKLEIVTPEKKVFDSEVDSVTVPTASGEAGILSNHAPLVSALKPGVLTYVNKGTAAKMAVGGGFVEVSNNQVSVLTDSAETADEIDADAARSLREEAEKALSAAATADIETTAPDRDKLDLANARLQLAAGK
jgi:F-type H+-transporting ATPase subunit epsilon